MHTLKMLPATKSYPKLKPKPKPQPGKQTNSSSNANKFLAFHATREILAAAPSPSFPAHFDGHWVFFLQDLLYPHPRGNIIATVWVSNVHANGLT